MTFKPGQSGNPKGRPVGVADKRARYRELLESGASQVIEKLVEKAKSGDIEAIRLVVDRLIPKVKPDEGINFSLPVGGIDESQNMIIVANSIVKAVAAGEMSITEADQFNELLNKQRSQIEKAERRFRYGLSLSGET